MSNSENANEELNIKKLQGNEIAEADEFITFKVIIVGNSGVGKSSFLKRAAQNKFTDSYQATIGFEFLLLYYDVNGTKIKLQIWDTCGQEMYRSLIQGFYRNTSLTVLLYSIDDQRSFDDLESWIKDIKNSAENGQPIFLVANKSDLDKELRKIKEEDGNEFAKANSMEFFSETSARTGYKVDEIFLKIVSFLYKENYLKGKNKLKKLKLGQGNKDLEITTPDKKKKKCC